MSRDLPGFAGGSMDALPDGPREHSTSWSTVQSQVGKGATATSCGHDPSRLRVNKPPFWRGDPRSCRSRKGTASIFIERREAEIKPGFLVAALLGMTPFGGNSGRPQRAIPTRARRRSKLRPLYVDAGVKLAWRTGRVALAGRPSAPEAAWLASLFVDRPPALVSKD